jgi:TRAP-type C4-dicarboxylate transport system permease large subunit
MLNVLLFILGMILHGNAILLLTVPLALPIMNELGVNPIHFGILMALNIGIGQQTPPVASVLLTVCSLAKIDIPTVWAYLKWFLLAAIAGLLIITYIPWFSLVVVS